MLSLFLYVAGGAQILLSAAAFTAAVGAMHEMTAAVLFGFGIVAIALGAIHDAIRDSRQQANSSVPAQRPSAPRRPGEFQTGDTIKRHKGYSIIKTDDGVRVNGQQFTSVIDAEKHVNDLAR